VALQLIGAGLPRTATWSLKQGLEALLGGRCYHMRSIPGHPFDLGRRWRQVLSGGPPDWEQMYADYVAAVDWPTSLFWRRLSEAYPDAPVLLSVRDSAETWWKSAEATILPYARLSQDEDWHEGRDFLALLERFTGTPHWDNPAILMAAYERHNETVRQSLPPARLLEWQPCDGWEPICKRLSVPVPAEPFPWTNKREEWG
jgi:hypothetical protein